MKYYKNTLNEFIVLTDQEIFNNALLKLAFEFCILDSKEAPLITFYTANRLENYTEIGAYEVMFSARYQTMLKSIIRDKDRLEKHLKNINYELLKDTFNHTIKEIEELIKQF